MFPVRCYTCNSVVADRWEAYERILHADQTARVAFNTLCIERMCCRRMFLGHVDLGADLIRYPNEDMVLDEGGTVLHRKVMHERAVSCD